MGTDVVSLDFTPDRVKAIRIALGLTQQDFAAKLGVSLGIVSRWERGQAQPCRGPVLKGLLDLERLARDSSQGGGDNGD